jgi:hypothetical protein
MTDDNGPLDVSEKQALETLLRTGDDRMIRHSLVLHRQVLAVFDGFVNPFYDEMSTLEGESHRFIEECRSRLSKKWPNY